MMFNQIGSINWGSVLVAALASFALGGVWFAGLFARQYARALGRENLPATKPAPLFLVGPFLCGLINASTSAVLMQRLHIESIGGAAVFGALIGFGYLAATTVNTAINPNMPRPLFYGFISGMYFLISGIVVSIILVAIR